MKFIPHMVSWNLTRYCNLRCQHCYSGDFGAGSELSTQECLEVIDQLAEVNPHTLLILSGGEPLLRNDISAIAHYGSKKGFTVVIGTNGTLITRDLARDLIHCGVTGVGVSLDSLNPNIHDRFRGLPGAWEATLQGIEVLRDVGLDFIVQTTATSHNYQEIFDLIEFSWRIGAKAFNLFFLVCTGRGQALTDITPVQYETLLANILTVVEKEDRAGRVGMINIRCAPHYYRMAQKKPQLLGRIRSYPKGCPAATYYCRITAEGDITPCPYLPLSAGNLRHQKFSAIWAGTSIFQALREGNLEGHCGRCEYSVICGGCRARAYAFSQNLLAEDPWCLYEPKASSPVRVRAEQYGGDYGMETEKSLSWTPEAKEHLTRIPSFVRGMVVKKVEEFARKNGYQEITLEIMKQTRKNSLFHLTKND